MTDRLVAMTASDVVGLAAELGHTIPSLARDGESVLGNFWDAVTGLRICRPHAIGGHWRMPPEVEELLHLTRLYGDAGCIFVVFAAAMLKAQGRPSEILEARAAALLLAGEVYSERKSVNSVVM